LKIRFENSSVSGVSRRYRGFSLDIPGRSAVTVDVPAKYVNDVLAHIKKRHPAVVCLPGKPVEAVPETPDAEKEADKPDETGATGETEPADTGPDETEPAETGAAGEKEPDEKEPDETEPAASKPKSKKKGKK